MIASRPAAELTLLIRDHPAPARHPQFVVVAAAGGVTLVTATLNIGVVLDDTAAAPVFTSTSPRSCVACVAVGILKTATVIFDQGRSSSIVGRNPNSVPSFSVSVAKPLSGAVNSFV